MTYYPILKLLNAEMGALENLRPESSEMIIPVIESKIISKDNINEWWRTFNTLGTYLYSKIGPSKFIYDFNSAFEKIGVVNELKDPQGQNLIIHCVEKLRNSNLNFIPCIHFDSPNWIIESALQSCDEEVAIRIRCHNFNSTLEDLIIERINEKIINSYPNKQYTLILDFYTSINYDRILTSLNNLSKLKHNKLVLSLTNCPIDAARAKPNSFTLVREREDIKTYFKVKKDFTDLHFSDYTVRLRPDLDPMTINYYNTYLKIFYSSEDDYYIGKSTLLENNGIESFKGICQEIVESDVYLGEHFSYGDKAIKDCADGKLSVTNHQKTIEYGINHHLELTARQL